jgi:hypothetical protein
MKEREKEKKRRRMNGSVSPVADAELEENDGAEEDYYLLNPEMSTVPRPERSRQLPARYR